MAGRLSKLVERLVESFMRGERRGHLLALVAAAKLWERGEKVTARHVAREAGRILECSRGRFDWGLERLSVEDAEKLLRELAEMDILERIEGGSYRIKRHGSEDPFAEVAEAMAPLLIRAL